MLSSVKSFVIAFAVSLIIFGVLGYYSTPYLKDVTDNFIRPASGELETKNSGEVTQSHNDVVTRDPDIDPTSAFAEHRSFTMLLVGSDYQPDVFSDYRAAVANSSDIDELASHQRHYSADVIVLVRYSAELGTVIFSAIPSNMNVTAGGINMKLGEVLEKKNISYFVGTVSSITGLNIDYYVCCQIKLFAQIVDKLGGMKFDVPVDMYYVDPEERIVEEGASREPVLLTDAQGRPIYDQEGNPIYVPAGKDFKIDLKAGIQPLTGEKATWVLRFDQYATGYAGCRDTQVKFFRAFFEQFMKDEMHLRLSNIINDIINSAYGSTNLTPAEFEEIAKTLLSYSLYEKDTVAFPGKTAINNGVESVSYSRNEAYATYAKYKLK